jgi:organic hydroperoxide reductase OsmC/OhrA
MQEFPHRYTIAAAAAESGDVELTAEGLPPLRSAAPAEFGGPGNRWSPETLLAAAVGDCFILTFRAVARMSKIQWTSIRCNVVGTLERRDRAIRFTKFEIHACLTVPAGTDAGRARRALDNAEHSCLIANSLNAPVDLVADITVDGDPDGEPVQACHRERQPLAISLEGMT